MTRHPLNQLAYASDPSLEYRQARGVPPIPHDRSMSLSLCRQNPRTDPMTRQTSRSGSGSHGSSANANSSGTPRRRIQVACGRCRKRKIRCSGDPGDGTGCTNCKGASVAHGTCVFLRVQCEMAELVPDHMLMVSGYEQVSSATIDLPPHPYSSSSSASSSSSSLALGHPHATITSPAMHHHHGLNSQHLLGQLPMRHHTMNPAGLSSDVMSMKSVHHQDTMGGTGGTDGSGLILGGDMSNGTSGGSGISSGDLYNGNYPQFLQPEIATSSSLISGQQGQWSSLPSSGRQANSGLYLDQDQAPTLQNYMPAPSTRMPSHTSLDGYNTIFPALSSLSSSLPEGISPRTTLADRVTLPSPFRTPASENISLRTSSTNDLTSGNYVTQSVQPPTVGRSYSPWAGESGFTTTSTSSSNPTVPTTKASAVNISPPLSYLSPVASHPTQSIIPLALPLPPTLTQYSTNTSPIFPLSSSNSSLLPSGPHSSSILNSSFDSFTSQPLQSLSQQPKSIRSDSESSSGGANTSGANGSSGTGTTAGGSSSGGGSGSGCTAGSTNAGPSNSKMNTPATTMRTSSTSSSACSPTYPRSSGGGSHDFVSKLFAAHMD
ncbi:hypothetical protein C7212DRAFT_204841 [Tuber magnatum]|uniref:Zn(2)-C6 fungal-type domain-containing protein n=1 Tax=Tuber magnatum TaxID=42249 RepID=A0A317SMJ5_9PEZI|nr:hypothetical protein C7212DRAFT_204841 [Tuber magnatum]